MALETCVEFFVSLDNWSLSVSLHDKKRGIKAKFSNFSDLGPNATELLSQHALSLQDVALPVRNVTRESCYTTWNCPVAPAIGALKDLETASGVQNVSCDFGGGGGKRTIECALQNQFWRAQKVGLIWSVPVPSKENDIA